MTLVVKITTYLCSRTRKQTDMYGDRAQNHDTDLEFHYGWENKLNYDSDGYDDEEDW